MANSLNYEIFQTWSFYSILNQKLTHNHNILFEKSIDSKIYTHYVKSWRWLPLDDVPLLESLYEQNRIVKFLH